MITGESRPVRRGAGDTVVAGTVATDSGLRVRVTAVGDDTALAGIQRLVAEAQNSTSRAQRLADRAAGWLFWFALVAAAITAVVWTLLGMPDEAVVRTITVLVIACPHALGLAIPLVVSIATERAARARRAREGPPRPGEHAHRRHGAVRQDRHPHQGRARRDRDRDRRAASLDATSCLPWRLPPSPIRSIRSPGRSSGRRATAGSRRLGPAIRVVAGRSASRARSTDRVVQVGGPQAARARGLRRAARRATSGAGRARSSCTCCVDGDVVGRAAARRRDRAPSRVKPSPRCRRGESRS